MLGNIGGELGDLLSGVMGSGETGEDDCITILSSFQFSNAIIQKFDLESIYKFKKRKKYFYADVLKTFYENFSVEVNDESAIVIGMRDRSPVRAKEIIEYAITLLDSLYLDIQKISIRQNLNYIDSVVSSSEHSIRVLEDSIAIFQKKFNLFMPDIQFETALKEIGELEIERSRIFEQMMKESSLRGKESPFYKRLSSEKQVISNILASKFNKRLDTNSIVLPLNMIPDLGIEYYRLEREYKIKLAVFKELTKQSKLLELELGKNVQQITIIDPPWINEKKVSPAKRIIVQIVFVLSLVLAIFLALCIDYYSKLLNSDSQIKPLIINLKERFWRIK